MEFLLSPRNTLISYFYGLPKIHKPNCLLYPICFRMWWSNWPSFILSCPFYPASSQQLSLTHKKHKRLPQPYRKTLTLPNQCILSNSWCLVAIHKNPHNDGIRAVKHFMEEYKHLLAIDCSPPPTVLAILSFIHKHNTFNFMVTHIHQILGTFMETRLALPMTIFSWVKKNV